MTSFGSGHREVSFCKVFILSSGDVGFLCVDVVPSATAIVPKDPDDEVVVVIPDWFGLDGPRNENYYIEGRKRAALRVAQQEAQQQIGQRSVASFSMDLMDKSSVLSSSCSTLMAQRRKAQKKKHTASNTNGAGKSDSSATVAKNDPIVWAAQEVKPVFVKREERSRVGSVSSAIVQYPYYMLTILWLCIIEEELTEFNVVQKPQWRRKTCSVVEV